MWRVDIFPYPDSQLGISFISYDYWSYKRYFSKKCKNQQKHVRTTQLCGGGREVEGSMMVFHII